MDMVDIPGTVASVEQPLAQVGIKIYGDDLNILRTKAKEMEAATKGIDG